MSFNDLNDLESQSGSYSRPSAAPADFARLTKSISQKIFTINSNVALIHRYIGLIGTARDTDKMRTSLMEALSRTKDVSKDVVPEIRSLTRWDPDEIGPSEKYEQQKLTGDFQKAATDFQNAQRLALEKQKEFVKDRKAAIEEEQAEFEQSPDGRGQLVRHPPQQQGLQLLDNSEIEFNERLIEEREQEIQGIEQGIVELNEIFRDLGTIVTEQGSLIDNIASNVENMTHNVRSGAKQLVVASRHQKNARKRACWLMLILCVILAVVLLAVPPRQLAPD